MPKFEIAPVVAEECRGLLNLLGSLNARGAGVGGVTLDACEDVFGLGAFRNAPLVKLQRITPALTSGALRVLVAYRNKLRRFVGGARSAPIRFLILFRLWFWIGLGWDGMGWMA